MKARAKLLASLLVAVMSKGVLADGGPNVTLSISSDRRNATLSNGFVRVVLKDGGIASMSGDFEGASAWGQSVGRMGLETELADGGVRSSAASGSSPDFRVRSLSQSADAVVVSVTGIADAPVATAQEAWQISLRRGERFFSLTARGSMAGDVSAGSVRTVRHAWSLSPSSITGFYKGGVVQMRNADPKASFRATRDELLRVFALGGPKEEAAGNMSIDIETATEGGGGTGTTALVSSTAGTGFHRLLVNDFPLDMLDRWTAGWSAVPGSVTPPAISAGQNWSVTVRVGVNNRDFPVLAPATTRSLADSAGMATDNMQAMLTGIYASPTGCLCTAANEVDGETSGTSVGQIATSIASPGRGYSGTYNFFDPDNFISTSALLWSGDPYLQEQVRRVVERNGQFINQTSGQLPHHFVGVKPTYNALSGEVQTGPNVFWILACLNYAKTSGNLDWLRQYMPRLRLASKFLNTLVDPKYGMANVPGSLMIDVFLRSGFTTDTNAMLGGPGGFLSQFADAEDAVGDPANAVRLRSLAARVAAGVNRYLWAADAAGADHYVTDWAAGRAARDFVDYDANLIAAAHGLPTAANASRMFERIDHGPRKGECRPSSTFVSEKWYGPKDTTQGNIGDSWCAMGRIAWFDALARRRYGDVAGFESHLLNPLKSQLLKTTWMHERLHCDGTQELNRTAHYFEYPSTVAMLLHRVRYGIELGFTSLELRPTVDGKEAASGFSYAIGDIRVDWRPPSGVSVSVPAVSDSTQLGKGRQYTVAGMEAGRAYTISVSGGPCHGHSPPTSPVTADDGGVLSFSAPAGVGCVVKAERSNGVRPAGRHLSWSWSWAEHPLLRCGTLPVLLAAGGFLLGLAAIVLRLARGGRGGTGAAGCDWRSRMSVEALSASPYTAAPPRY